MYRGGVLLVCHDGKVVDRLRISDTHQLKGSSKPRVVEGTSLDVTPRQYKKFCKTRDGWRITFPDPFTGAPCYSHRAPAFQLFETDHS